jgi:hypothetical protein
MGEKGKVLASHPSLRGGRSPRIRQTKFLILFVEVCVKTLVALGRNYSWEKPKQCPKCNSVRLWGHGYTEAYFDEAGSQSVLLKRYRCPECGTVIRLRPVEYWRRIQAPIATVRQCMVERLEKGRWPPQCHSARARHWLRGLRRQVRTRLGMGYADKLAEGFSELLRRGVCAVSRAV